MARKVVFVDDLTGKEIAEGDGGPVRFALGDDTYEMDLGKESLAKLEKALGPFIERATAVEDAPKVPTKVSRAPQKRSGQRATTDKEQLQAMREWLRSQGHTVSDRGRIAQNLQDLYNEAHP